MITPRQRYFLGTFEDDFYGLWELDWTFNSSFPDLKPNERIATITPLFRDGLMHLFIRNDISEKTDPLDPVTAADLISDYSNWAPPTVEGELSHFFTTSEDGVRCLQDSPSEDPDT